MPARRIVSCLVRKLPASMTSGWWKVISVGISRSGSFGSCAATRFRGPETRGGGRMSDGVTLRMLDGFGVANEQPQRLHDHPQCGIARRLVHPALERGVVLLEVGVVLGMVAHPVQCPLHRLDLLVGDVLRRGPRDHRFEHQPDVDDITDVRTVDLEEQLHDVAERIEFGPFGYGPTADARLDRHEVSALEEPQRLTHRRACHAELADHFLLGRQALTLDDATAEDLVGHHVGHPRGHLLSARLPGGGLVGDGHVTPVVG